MYTFIDWILFILLALCVGYLLFYAIASKFYRPRKLSEARILRRFLVLFPAYKEDRVIVSTIRSFLKQEYPKEMYDVLVISDQMLPYKHSPSVCKSPAIPTVPKPKPLRWQ